MRRKGRHRRRVTPTAKRRRKRIRQGERIKAREIYERDEWTCKLCGLPVERKAKGKHPWKATLDHVIPLAKGGRHCKNNVQCAHWKCNNEKGDSLSMPMDGKEDIQRWLYKTLRGLESFADRIDLASREVKEAIEAVEKLIQTMKGENN
jgi:5-methylcytosine-specific restriction endonuclease McrA